MQFSYPNYEAGACTECGGVKYYKLCDYCQKDVTFVQLFIEFCSGNCGKLYYKCIDCVLLEPDDDEV